MIVLHQIDPIAMRQHGVRLGWSPGVNKRAVAELEDVGVEVVTDLA